MAFDGQAGPEDQRGGVKSEHNIGISTKVWHSDEEDRELYLGNAEIVVTRTQDVESK